MIEINGERKVTINLNAGIYVFSNTSSTGKTFLYKILSKFTSRRDILCITYSNYRLISNLKEFVEKNNVKLLLFDRYDMYAGEFADDIIAIKDDIIILMDYKHGDIFNRYAEECEIELREDTLEVFAYDSSI